MPEIKRPNGAPPPPMKRPKLTDRQMSLLADWIFNHFTETEKFIDKQEIEIKGQEQIIDALKEENHQLEQELEDERKYSSIPIPEEEK